MTGDQVLARLRTLADPSRLTGMARYGIATERALGVTVAELRVVAKDVGRDHALAGDLWGAGLHEARIPHRPGPRPPTGPGARSRWSNGPASP